MKWEANIFYLENRYIAWPDHETIVGPLRSIECYLRSNAERISHVEIRPVK